MDSHQDLLHNFKIICQMFVHAAIAEDRELFMEDAISKHLEAYLQLSMLIWVSRKAVLRRTIAGKLYSVVDTCAVSPPMLAD
jgi:hypothetical protein